jgi:hypothetical protein
VMLDQRRDQRAEHALDQPFAGGHADQPTKAGVPPCVRGVVRSIDL